MKFGSFFSKEIITLSFYQLLFIYFIFIFLISLNFVWEYSYHFEVFALLLGVLSLFVKFKKKKLMFSKYWIIIPLLILLFMRISPYLDNTVPLGYDPGIYKAGFETYRESLPELYYDDGSWVSSAIPVGLPIITNFMYLIGFDSITILTYLLIFFELLNLLMVYLVSKVYFNREVALFNSFLFAVSPVEILTYWFGYYKNIVAILLFLLALYLIKQQKYFMSTLTIGFLGGLHRPTFFIYGLGHFFYWLRTFKRGLLLTGMGALVLTFGFYAKNLVGFFFETGIQFL